MSGGSEDGQEWAVGTVLALLTLIYLIPFTYALPFADGIRDLQVASDIARGISYPLLGPVFANRFHAGPAGYYLQALPLWFGLSLSTVPLFLGMLASSKFLLAYGFGKEWIDRRFGLLLASALALPGWSGLDFLNTTTPMLVPALVLADMWCTLRFVRRQSTCALLGAALTTSLAVHAHPGAVVFVPVLAGICVWHAARARLWWSLIGASGVAILPLLPALVAVVRSGWRVLLAVESATVVVPGSGNSLIGWFEAARGFALGGPLTTLRTLGSESWGTSLAWLSFTIAAVGLLLLLWAAVARKDVRARWLAALLAGVTVAIFAARSNTPWYFVHPLSVAYALAVATGWRQLPKAISAIPVLALGLAATQSAGVVHHLQRGEGDGVTAELMDIRLARGERGPTLGSWVSVRHWPELAAFLCAESSRPTALHGELAIVVDDQGALAAREACDVTQLRLGGAAERHWVGVPRAIWSTLGWSPSVKIASLGVFEAGVVAADEIGHALADPRRYPMRTPVESAPVTREYRIEAPADHVLLVGRLSPAFAKLNVVAAAADGQPVTAFYRDAFAQAFHRPQANMATTIWIVQLTSSDPAWVDIVTFGQSR
jgi:hypothetical protein